MRKQPALIFIVIFFFLSGSAFATDGITIIKGRFTNFNAAVDKQYIDLTISDLVKPIKVQERISGNGEFEFNLKISDSCEVTFKYDGKSLYLILSPSDSIYLLIDRKKFIEGKDYTKNISISGKTLFCNQLIQHNYALLQDLMDSSLRAFFADSSLSNENYKAIRLSQLEEQKNKWNNFASRNNIHDKLFLNWASAFFEYAAGEDLCLFPFIDKRSKDLNDTSDYSKFTDRISLENHDARFFTSYLDYIRKYKGFIEIICSFYPGYSTNRQNSMNEDTALHIPFSFYLKKINEHSYGLSREYLQTLFFYSRYKRLAVTHSKYLDSMQLNLSNDLYLKIIESTDFAKEKIIDCINKFNADATLKNRLKDYFKNTEGKVVYIDFWFYGCGPCMAELPYYNDFMNMYNDKVVFISFSVYTNKNQWQSIIGKYHLKKWRNFLLNKNEAAFFEKYLNIYGYPHHTIIGKDGTIEVNFNTTLSENKTEVENTLNKYVN